MILFSTDSIVEDMCPELQRWRRNLAWWRSGGIQIMIGGSTMITPPSIIPDPAPPSIILASALQLWTHILNCLRPSITSSS